MKEKVESTDTQSEVFTATRTLFPTVYVPNHERPEISKSDPSERSSPPTVPTPYPHPGTRLYDYGSYRPATPPAALSDTTTMYSPYHSPQTTDKSYQDRATRASSCGTHWATANSPSPTKVTRTGSRACASHQTLRTRSLLVLDGTNTSR